MKLGYENAIVVISEQERPERNFATGFIIDCIGEQGFIVTSAHSIRDMRNGDDLFAAGKPAKVACSGEAVGIDFAVLKAELGDAQPLNACCDLIGKRSVQVAGFHRYGEGQIVLSPPLSGSLAVEQRMPTRSGKYVQGWKIVLEGSGKLAPGYSGSPVFDDETGMVIGVITHMDADPRSGLVVSIEGLRLIWPDMPEDLVGISKCGDLFDGLRDLLKRGQWHEANKETQRLLGNVFNAYAIPLSTLKQIDRLWFKYSNDHFGIGIQRALLKKYNMNFDEFSSNIGWSSIFNPISLFSVNKDDLQYKFSSPVGHLPMPFLLGNKTPVGFAPIAVAASSILLPAAPIAALTACGVAFFANHVTYTINLKRFKLFYERPDLDLLNDYTGRNAETHEREQTPD